MSLCWWKNSAGVECKAAGVGGLAHLRYCLVHRCRNGCDKRAEMHDTLCGRCAKIRREQNRAAAPPALAAMDAMVPKAEGRVLLLGPPPSEDAASRGKPRNHVGDPCGYKGRDGTICADVATSTARGGAAYCPRHGCTTAGCTCKAVDGYLLCHKCIKARRAPSEETTTTAAPTDEDLSQWWKPPLRPEVVDAAVQQITVHIKAEFAQGHHHFSGTWADAEKPTATEFEAIMGRLADRRLGLELTAAGYVVTYVPPPPAPLKRPPAEEALGPNKRPRKD